MISPKDISLKGLEKVCDCWKSEVAFRNRYKDDEHHIDCNLTKVQQHIANLLNGIIERINKFENHYPKDIFVWDNKEKLDFNRGRFNQHCFEIVENVREQAKQIIEEKIR